MQSLGDKQVETMLDKSDSWAKKSEEDAATMCAKRMLTEEEIDRAMVIGKWFFGWTDKIGPCPISVTNEHWGKKLCALFEWIAVLETEAREPNKSLNPLESGQSLEQDCFTLALRLLGEDPATFSPETAEVMDRWRPVCIEHIKSMGGTNEEKNSP
jgi:hypothetical protein